MSLDRLSPSPRRAILVVGMHRSGTSALTRTLNLLGATLPADLIASAEDNPAGFWESAQILDSHDRFLAAVGSRWDDPRPLPPPVFTQSAALRCQDELLAYLSRDLKAAPLLVIKDPRMCRLLPVWKAVLTLLQIQPLAVHTVRNPLETAMSLRVRNQMSREQALALWLISMVEGERETRDWPRVFVDYDAMVQAPQDQARRVARLLGCFEDATIEQSLPAIGAFWSQTLRHHHFPLSPTSDQALPVWVQQMAHWLNAAAHEQAPDCTMLDQMALALNQATEMFGGLVASPAQSHADDRLQDANATLARELVHQGEARATLETRLHQANLDLDLLRRQQDQWHLNFQAMNGAVQDLRAQAIQLRQNAHERQDDVQQLAQGLDDLQQGWQQGWQLLHDSLEGLGQSHTQLQEQWVQSATDTNDKMQHWWQVWEQDRQQQSTQLRQTMAGMVKHHEAQTQRLEQALLRLARISTGLYGHISLSRRVGGWLRAALTGHLKRRLGQDRDIASIARSGLFDADFYLSHYGDVAQQRLDPLVHYVRRGAAEGRNPHPGFDTRYYLSLYPEVAKAGINPLAHYARFGMTEGRRTHSHPLAASGGGLSPLLHYSLFAGSRAAAAAPILPVLSHLPAPPVPADTDGFQHVLQQHQNQLQAARAQVADRESIIASLYQSPWWRITKPLRLLTGHRLPGTKAAPPPLTFTHSVSPDVSIIIPVYGNLDDTLACLTSLSRHNGPDVTVEIIVADDKVDQPIVAQLPQAEGLIAYVNHTNLGFLRNCNQAASRARGRHLLFLNSDTQVEAHWLAPMVQLADAHRDVGMVGCTLLNADGTIQDAGWTIGRDGWGRPIGRNRQPGLSEFSYVREVDCVGGACFLVPRDKFQAAGGLDEAFAPAYYEEFDLAFTLRRRGYRVLVQPASRVKHWGSNSYGSQARDDLSTAHHAVFIRKWAAELACQPLGDEDEFRLRHRHGQCPAILIIDDKLPEYDHHAGGMAMDQYLHLLTHMGWRVIFAPANGKPTQPYLPRLQQAGIEVIVSPDTLADWYRRHGRHLAVIWTSRPSITTPLLPLFAHRHHARLVYFTHDLHYLREQRRYEVERDPAILVIAATVRQQETAIFRQVDRVLTPSQAELEHIRQDVPGISAMDIPLYCLPPRTLPPRQAQHFHDRHDIVFVGGFPHTPNVDAALWLVRDIMPLVWERHPQCRLWLVGYAPPPEVTALAGPRIEVTGHVPDLDPFYRLARMTVAPLRFGAGVKGKILSALAAGLPVVTTTIGAEGIGLIDGQSALLADQARELAQAIIRLLDDAQLCADLAEAGLQWIDHRFSVSSAKQALTTALDFAIAEPIELPQPPPPAEPPPPPDTLASFFCTQPWENVDIYDGGAYACCPAWNNNTALGNIHSDSPDEIWNGHIAQRFRQGILDGSFAMCDHQKCNLILDHRLPRRDALPPQWQAIIASGETRSQQGPRYVKLGYDSSCNLSCPSCRTHIEKADSQRQTHLDDTFDNRIQPLLNDAEILLMSSDGDPFGSAHYRRIVEQTAEKWPQLGLGLCTNGQLLTPQAWDRLHLEGRTKLVQISVDAATAKTYAQVRRPGRFDILMRNLEFLSLMRQQNRLDRLDLSFVVQTANYREMADFVRLCQKLHADVASFTLIDQWARGMDEACYQQAKIWDPRHPHYQDFLHHLADPAMDAPITCLNSLQAIREGWHPPAIEVTANGAIRRDDTQSIERRLPHALSAAAANPDLVLVQAPGWGVNTPPLATAMLSAYARRQGYTVLALDLNLEFYAARSSQHQNCWDLEKSQWFWNTRDAVLDLMQSQQALVDAFVDTVLDSNAPLVGFTVYESSAIMTLELARLLKERRPNLTIVLGGPHVSRDIAGPTIILNDAIDAVAQGEGEEVLIQLIKRTKDGSPLDDCPGLLLKRQGQVVDTGDAPPIRDLDGLPPADFSDFDFPAYRTPTRLPIMGSRGCPNRCIYCNERTYWKSFRFRSAESIVAEIITQRQNYPFLDFIDFQDSLVNGKISQLQRFAQLLLEKRITMQWAGQAVIRKEMTSQLLTLLKQSGCVCLAYGLENPSPTLMQSIGKVLSRSADMDELARAHGESGLTAVYNVMFGLPGETQADAEAVLEFLRRNHQYGLVVNPSTSFCAFSPGTPGYQEADKYGIDFSKGGLYWESRDGSNTYPIRLQRFEAFCRLVQSLGIETTYPAAQLLDRDRALGRYYQLAGDRPKALSHFQAWLDQHSDDGEVREIIAHLRNPDSAA